MPVSRPRSSSWKWYLCGLLLLATTINYMDRVTLGNASVRVTTEFGLTEEQYGHLELVFGWAFALGSVVFGFLADRFRIYWLYPVVLAGWSIMGMATGWAQGYTGLLVCRTLLGFFEAGHWPCALKTTFAVLNEKDRTMGNSILQSGASIGAVITPQVMKLLMTQELGSWRRAFIVVGVAGLVWVMIWLLMMRGENLDRRPEQRNGVAKTPLCAILLSRRFWAVAVLILGTQTTWHIYRVWLVKFLQTGRGYAESAALDFSSLYFICTDVGCFAAGFISVWLIRKRAFSPHAARRWVYAAACVLTSLSLLLPWLGKGSALLAVLLLVGAGALALFPCYYSFAQELSDEHVGRVTGLLSFWAWAITAPMHSLLGIVVDATHSYDWGLAVAGLAPWLGVLAMALLWDRGKPQQTAA